MSKTYLCACGGQTAVKDSRSAAVDAMGIRRRRECKECGTRFTTFEMEIPEMPVGLLVILERLQSRADSAAELVQSLINDIGNFKSATQFLRDLEDSRRGAAKPLTPLTRENT